MGRVRRFFCAVLSWVAGLALASGCAHADSRLISVESRQAARGATTKPSIYHLHLSGIGGVAGIDYTLIEGLDLGGLGAQTQIYDWVSGMWGLEALKSIEANKASAREIGKLLAEKVKADPTIKIYITCHSAGAGLATWALESLPAEVKVESILYLAPALSPTYNLTAALKHVRGRAYFLYSPKDHVLGQGTRTFGTVDGVKCDAAGRVGFTRPKDADENEYAKLVAVGYEVGWRPYGHIGDHIGMMGARFSQTFLAPLLLTGKLPEIGGATTRASGKKY